MSNLCLDDAVTIRLIRTRGIFNPRLKSAVRRLMVRKSYYVIFTEIAVVELRSFCIF